MCALETRGFLKKFKDPSQVFFASATRGGGKGGGDGAGPRHMKGINTNPEERAGYTAIGMRQAALRPLWFPSQVKSEGSTCSQ